MLKATWKRPKALSPVHSAWRPWVELGLQPTAKGDWEAAKGSSSLAPGVAPADPDALHLYGATLLQTGEPSQALAFLQGAVHQRRNNPAMIGNLAQAYFA